MTPLRQLEGTVSITENLPEGVEAQHGQATRMTFPPSTSIDETAAVEFALMASEAIGRTPSSATLEIPGGTGEISGLGFNVKAREEPVQPRGYSAVVWAAILVGVPLLRVILLRARRS